MRASLSYRTNRDLFSNYYLDEHLPETAAWDEVPETDLREARADARDLWDREKATVEKRIESQLEEKFIRPMFRQLGVPFEVEEQTGRTRRRPDYGFFSSSGAAQTAFERREAGGDFYEDAVAVADAKRWDRPLDTRGSGEHERDFENPSYQIHVYLQETPARWAVLTNGRKWRLYYGPTSHRLDSYYEVDLPTILEEGDLEDFRYFYLFFRHGAFLEDASGDCFLDDVYAESNIFARELGEDLQDNVYEAIKVLAEGFLQYPDNDLTDEDLELIHDSSLVYLYRLIFVLYAESEGRDLLDTSNEIYEASYSLNTLKQEVAEELRSPSPTYRDWQTNLWTRLDELFSLVDQGSRSQGIPRDDLYVPAYNGGLFRTDPDQDDSPEARFLAEYEAGDAHLAQVIDLLTRSTNGNGAGKTFVDYSSLDVRHLGSIYEGLLEYQLDVADEPLAITDGEYVPADTDAERVVDEGEVYLTTDSGERKATGSYYTPEYVVKYIVENTLGPLVDGIREDLVERTPSDEGGFADEFAQAVFDLKILDPSMGSGHFLTSAIDYLAREIIDAQERQAAQQGVETVNQDHDINWARRQVAQRCIYGVDLNPLAVELAKVSLWLRTLAAEQPLAFLDHHLKTGNSLVGSDIEEIEELESEGGGDAQNASLADFGIARKGTIEQLMHIYQDFIAIENQDLADVKQIETKYDEFERNELRRRIEAMANVRTAEDFDLDTLPGDAYEQMAAALEDDDEWARLEDASWFRDAQRLAREGHYFHWKLEYPEVFYDQSGTERAEPGFDAVIGNPPWAITTDEQLKAYLWTRYEYQSNKPDLYRFFIEQCLRITSGKFSTITPNTWFVMGAAQSLRRYVLEHGYLARASLVPPDAFGHVDANMITFQLDVRDTHDEIDVWDLHDSGDATFLRSIDYDNVDSEPYKIELRVGSEERQLAHRMERDAVPLAEIAEATTGYQLYHTSIHSQEVIENEIYHADRQETDEYVPEVRSSSLSKFHVDPNPDGYIDSTAEFYRLPGDRFRQGPKVLVREVTGTKGIVAAHTDRELFFPKSVISLVSTDETYDTAYLSGLLNSDALSFYFLVSGEKSSQDLFPRLSITSLKQLPIVSGQRAVPMEVVDGVLDDCTVDDEFRAALAEHAADETTTAGLIAHLADRISVIKQEAGEINTALFDYLGTYEEGATVGEHHSYQPAPGVSGTILSKTREEQPKLKLDAVDVERTASKLVVSAVARYRPDDEEAHETDRWGYTRTEPVPIAEFVGLDEFEGDLVAEFVEHVVNDADDGTAEFRPAVTKTNSLVDRFKSIELPDVDDVRDDFERYLEQSRRVEQLESRLQCTERLVNELVYESYEITDEERQVIENAISDD